MRATRIKNTENIAIKKFLTLIMVPQTYNQAVAGKMKRRVLSIAIS